MLAVSGGTSFPQRSGENGDDDAQDVKGRDAMNIDADDGATGGAPSSDNVTDATILSYAKWKLVVIAVKSIGHACTSSFATLLSSYEPTGVGFAIWTVFILVGMHLWFNVRLEYYVCPYKQKRIHAMSRAEREWMLCQKQEQENNERRRNIQARIE
jgi:hypothetical protein